MSAQLAYLMLTVLGHPFSRLRRTISIMLITGISLLQGCSMAGREVTGFCNVWEAIYEISEENNQAALTENLEQRQQNESSEPRRL